MYKEVSLSNLPTHCSLKFASAVFAQLRSSVICTNTAFTVLIIEKTNTLTSTYTHTPYPYTQTSGGLYLNIKFTRSDGIGQCRLQELAACSCVGVRVQKVRTVFIYIIFTSILWCWPSKVLQ